MPPKMTSQLPIAARLMSSAQPDHGSTNRRPSARSSHAATPTADSLAFISLSERCSERPEARPVVCLTPAACSRSLSASAGRGTLPRRIYTSIHSAILSDRKSRACTLREATPFTLARQAPSPSLQSQRNPRQCTRALSCSTTRQVTSLYPVACPAAPSYEQPRAP